MADIEITRTHDYGLDDAKVRLEKLLGDYMEHKPDMVNSVSWQDLTATATGRFFKGRFTVSESDVQVELELIGFAAKMAKGMVREQMGKQLERGGFSA